MSPGNPKFVLQVCKSVSVWKIGSSVPLVCLRLSSPGSPLASPITGIECLLSCPSHISVANAHMSLKPKSRSVSSVESNSFQPHGLQRTRLPCPSPTPGACSHSQPLSQWCHPTISSSVFSLSQNPPAFSVSQHQDPFQWVSSLHQMAKVLELQLQHQSFQWIFRTDFL